MEGPEGSELDQAWGDTLRTIAEIAAQQSPEDVRRELRQLQELRDSEGYIE